MKKQKQIKHRDPNWRDLEALRKSGAAGSHKDKKKLMKKGYTKHKGKDDMSESIYTNPAGGKLSKLGRILMDKAVTTKDDALSNVMSRVGSELTMYGEPSGAQTIEELVKRTRVKQESILKLMKWAEGQKDVLDKVKDPDPKPEDDEDDEKESIASENTPIGHTDDERNMIRKNLYQMAKYAKETFDMLEKLPADSDFPHWWQAKITNSLAYMSKAKHYLENELNVPDLGSDRTEESVAPISEALLESVGKEITEDEFEKLAEKKDACYRKVKARYKVWPSAYASGALVQCRKKGAANWGKSKK